MPRRRLLQASLLLFGLAAVLYLAVSLFVPSSRELIVGVNKHSGRVRVVKHGITFLPPNEYYRLAFEKRNGWAQRDGVITITSREGVPVKLNYRLRFGIDKPVIPNARQLVTDGWTAWLQARVGEAVSAVTQQVSLDDLASPLSPFGRQRDRLARVVAAHLAESGLEVTAFAIERIEIDHDDLLARKRLELRRDARGAAGRVALFALDGADWQLLSELIDDDRLPNLKALVSGGATASVQTVQPTVSPLVWTTVATGLPPDRHGVIDFFDSSGQPVDSSSRHSPALWEIAPAFGRSAEVVNWWTAWPVDGNYSSFDIPAGLVPAALLPASAADSVGRHLIREETIGYPQMQRFVNMLQPEYDQLINQPSSSLAVLRSTLAKTWTDHGAAIDLFEAERPTLLMVNYDGTDVVNHLFGPYHPPLRDGVSQVGYRRYWPTVANYYSEVDRMIGEWMRILPPDTTVLVVSGYGMTWGSDRPLAPPEGTSALLNHRNSGVLIAYGNQIRPSRTRLQISVYDLAPSILALLGLPPSAEMPGHFVAPLFKDVFPIEGVKVTSYGEFVIPKSEPSDVTVDPKVYRARLERIGHIVDPGRTQIPMLDEDSEDEVVRRTISPQQFGLYAYYNNLGVQLRRKGDWKAAAAALQQAIDLNPSRPTPYLNLAILSFEHQRYGTADDLFEKAVVLGLAQPDQYYVDYAALYRQNNMNTRAINVLTHASQLFPESALVAGDLGSALAASERYSDASAELERALALRPTSLVALNDLGLIQLKKRDLARALDYWNRSLAIDPRQPQIRQAVAAVQSQL